MKNIFTFLFVCFVISSQLFSEEIEIDLGSGYANDVWYSFKNGVVLTSPNDNWDIAFSTDAQEAGIRINSQKGMALWVVKNSDEDSWEDPIDTTGMSDTWTQGFNSEEQWSLGAFNLGMDGFVTGGDFGWGAYNMVTHSITGNKVFVLKLNEDTYKRIMVDGLKSGVYTIKWADLDGSNEMTKDVPKASFSEQMFAWLDMGNNIFVDREPDFKNWDLVFGKYTALIPMGPTQVVPYGVTGVRMNRSYRAAMVENVPTDESTAPTLNDENYSGEITAIGSDWKKLDYDTFKYVILDSLSYFVTNSMDDDPTPNIMKMVFKTFDGSSTGKLTFELNGSASSVDFVESTEYFRVYPSITSSNTVITVESILNLNIENSSISIVNMMGETFVPNYSVNGNGTAEVNIPKIAAGNYFIIIDNQGTKYFSRIIVQ